LLSEEKNGADITKTFAVWGDADINTITFYRPIDIADPEPTDVEFMAPNEFIRPKNALPADCGINPPPVRNEVKLCAEDNPSYDEVMADLHQVYE